MTTPKATLSALESGTATPGQQPMPNDLPQPLYCRYGVCAAHEPHMPWCAEYTAGELAAAKDRTNT